MNKQALEVALNGSLDALRALLRNGLSHEPASDTDCDGSQESTSSSQSSDVSSSSPDPYFQDPDVSSDFQKQGVRPLMGLLHYAVLSSICSDPLQKVQDLLEYGCAWNCVDIDQNTAADIARARLALHQNEEDKKIFEAIYMLLISTGIRTEYFLYRLGSLNERSSEELCGLDDVIEVIPDGLALDNKAFLESKLRFCNDTTSGKTQILTTEGDAVMMGWEQPIMDHTSALLCHGIHREPVDFRVLNIGFGLGLLDQALQEQLEYLPLSCRIVHVIVEPHPDILQYMDKLGWRTADSTKRGIQIVASTWQQFVQTNTDSFDAVYFDTFSEQWSDLGSFFSHLPSLLKAKAPGDAQNPSSAAVPNWITPLRTSVPHTQIVGPRFSFFNGLGATNATFYDVYTAVAQLELERLGFQVIWEELPIDNNAVSDQAGDDIKRPYWSLPTMRIPIAYYP